MTVNEIDLRLFKMRALIEQAHLEAHEATTSAAKLMETLELLGAVMDKIKDNTE